MATYVMLANFTDQGIRNIKDTVKRAEAFKEFAQSSKVTIKEMCWTLGRYDIVVIAEAADETALTALELTLAKSGNIRTQTMRGFSAKEMAAILEKVS